MKRSADGAQEKRDHMHPVGAAALTAGGLSLAASPTTRGRLLGFQRVFHGTQSPEAAEAIKQEGLLKELGGTGAASWNKPSPERLAELEREGITYVDRFGEGSKGKTHVSPSKTVAKLYARGNPVLTADLPMDVWDQFERDPDSGPPLTGRSIAARAEADITPEHIHGGKGRAEALELLKKRIRGLPSYIKSHPGRFGLGVLGLGAGTAAAGKGGYELVGAARDALKKEGANMNVANEGVVAEFAEKLAGCPSHPKKNLKPKGKTALERFIDSRKGSKQRKQEKTAADEKKPVKKITRKEHYVIKKQLKEQEKKRKADKDLEKLVGSKPTPAQLARYSAIGGAVGGALHPLGTVVEGVPKGKSLAREALGARKIGRNIVSGAAFAAMTPMAKYHVDRYAAKKGKY